MDWKVVLWMPLASLPANKAELEQHHRAPEELAANSDEVAIWELVGHLQVNDEVAAPRC